MKGLPNGLNLRLLLGPNLHVIYEDVHVPSSPSQDPLSQQKCRLEASQQLQQFFRDVEDEEAWIKERKPVAASSNTGEWVG